MMGFINLQKVKYKGGGMTNHKSIPPKHKALIIAYQLQYINAVANNTCKCY